MEENPSTGTHSEVVCQERPKKEEVEFIQHSEEIKEIALALSKAQGAMPEAAMSGEVILSKGQYSYSNIADIWASCRAPLAENGLAVIQGTLVLDGKMYLDTFLTHSSGQWFRARYPIRPIGTTYVDIGIAIAYGKKYSLAAITGVASRELDENQAPPEDDGKKSEAQELLQKQPVKTTAWKAPGKPPEGAKEAPKETRQGDPDVERIYFQELGKAKTLNELENLSKRAVRNKDKFHPDKWLNFTRLIEAQKATVKEA